VSGDTAHTTGGVGPLVRDLEYGLLLLAGGGAGVLAAVTLVAVVVVVVLVMVAATSLNTFFGGVPGLGVLSQSEDPDGMGATEIPPQQLAVMRQVAGNSSCHLPWTVLAGVAFTESSFGRNMGPSTAGAIGYGQFMPATWAAYGAGGNPLDYRDALPAMERYLCAMVVEFGVGRSADDALRMAVFYYNHARSVPFNPNDSYVQHVLGLGAYYARASGATAAGSGVGLVSGWADRPALNQYACRNYRNLSDCQQWDAAACSATALDWLLGAYGVRLAGIDDAIALIGPGTGISTSVGLLDSSGTRLAAAETAEGLRSRRAQLHSTDELRSWLASGPLLLDGHRWFGVGHWFVAIASDAGGIFIRDSSGYDTRYLSWSRLYGEVGWSGWAVGVQAPQGGAAPA
jgi:hypothetical protein